MLPMPSEKREMRRARPAESNGLGARETEEDGLGSGQTVGEDFRLSHNDSVAPEQILTLLTEPKNSSGIVALLDLVGGHPLLCHRSFRAWELFHDPSG